MTWLAVAVFLFGFAVLLVWGIAGTIHTRVHGPAFITYLDAELTEVVAQGSGTLTSLTVDQGDEVERGDILGFVTNPVLSARLAESRRVVADSLATIERYEETMAAELAEFDRLQALRRAAMESQLAQASEMAEAFGQRLDSNQDLYDRGFAVVQMVDELRTQYFQAKQEIETVKNELAQLALDREERKTQWDQRILDLEARHSELLATVRELEEDVAQTETIYSPATGEVAPILVTNGTHLNAGDPVLTIVRPSATLEVMAFVDATDAKLIQMGMPVWISPTTYPEEEYGTILGQVTDISKFPLSAEALFAILQNRDLASQFLQESAPLLVSIEMQRDPDGGLAWTSRQTTPIEITAGTLASVSVVVREQAPISLVIPTLKEWTGLQ